MNENQAVEIQRMPRKNVWLLLFLGVAGAYLFHGVVFYGHPLGINVFIAVLCCYGVILGSQKAVSYTHLMEELRRTGDEMESITAKKYWPYPSYSDMLFSV